MDSRPSREALNEAWKELIAEGLRRNVVVAVGKHRAFVEAAILAALPSEPPSDPEGLRRTQYPGMDALEPVNECTCGHPKHAPGECDGPDESGRCGCMWGRSYNETVAARLSNDTAPEPKP